MNTEQKRILFGYTRNVKGQIIIHPLEMSIINTIYHAYLEGNSLGKISGMLKEAKLLSPSGKEVWGEQIIDNLLSNEKYTGSVIFQKTFVEDHLTHKQKNDGQKEKVLVTNNHEAIIDKK